MTKQNRDTGDSLLVDAREAAALLSVGERTFWRLVQRGILRPALSVGRKLRRWRGADLVAFVEGLP